MHHRSSLFLSAVILLTTVAAPVFAAHHRTGADKPPALSFFQKTFLERFTYESDKLVSLAEAFSDEGYAWRPAEGIRSVRETILHVAAANYGIGGRLGKTVPEGVNPREFEATIEGKEMTLQVLRDSIAFAKAAASGVDPASLEETIEFYGMKPSRMGAMLIISGHTEEHLGQLIAYARSSGVVPPWSQ